MKIIEHQGEFFEFPENDKQTYDESFEKLKSRVIKVIGRQVNKQRLLCGFGREDLYQLGLVALVESVHRYDPGSFVPTRGKAKPRTFFSYFYSMLMLKYQVYHDTYNVKVKAQKFNKRREKRLVEGLGIRRRTKELSVDRLYHDHYFTASLNSFEKGSAVGGFPAKPKLDMGGFLQTLTNEERLVVEAILDERVTNIQDIKIVKKYFNGPSYSRRGGWKNMVRKLQHHPQIIRLVELTV